MTLSPTLLAWVSVAISVMLGAVFDCVFYGGLNCTVWSLRYEKMSRYMQVNCTEMCLSICYEKTAFLGERGNNSHNESVF